MRVDDSEDESIVALAPGGSSGGQDPAKGGGLRPAPSNRGCMDHGLFRCVPGLLHPRHDRAMAYKLDHFGEPVLTPAAATLLPANWRYEPAVGMLETSHVWHGPPGGHDQRMAETLVPRTAERTLMVMAVYDGLQHADLSATNNGEQEGASCDGWEIPTMQHEILSQF